MNNTNEFIKEFDCSCKKHHNALIDDYIVKNGAILEIPHYIKKYNATKAFIIADKNTYRAAGERVCEVLEKSEIEYTKYIFTDSTPEPNEYYVGSAIMHFDNTCDIVIGIGSGVINDISKIVSKTSDKPYIIVATAPSMDGYASATSSVALDGLKISLPSKCANVVIGDIDIIKNAPQQMLVSGLGDMIAKYISISEWKISHIINNEYYCETIADMVKKAVKKCIDNADNLLKRDDKAVKAVFEGLVIAGAAMNYAGMSRPASGVEHYFSHIWDMRKLEFDTPASTHGIQCAIGTLYASKIYEQLRNYTPVKEKALNYAKNFDYSKYKETLVSFLGKGAEKMIELEKKEHKYGISEHSKRLEIIISNWDKISDIIKNEIPLPDEIEKILDTIKAPKTVDEIGLNKDILPMTFKATKDIRDKYVLSRLCWDLGIIDEIRL